MARRRKSSPAEDFMDLVSLLPWWAGVALALVLYLVLHAVAQQPVAVNAQPGQLGPSLTRAMLRSLATVGQYLLPFLCLVGAAASAWRRKERRRLVSEVAQSPSAGALHGMSWREFEALVGEGFRLQGYSVIETGGGGADGGVDLVLGKGGEKFLVQCKQWKAYKVGVEIVRELYGVMAARGAAGGFVVTSGRFTSDAVEFASGRNVKLVDGPKLHGLLRQAREAGAAQAMSATTSVAATRRPGRAPTSAEHAGVSQVSQQPAAATAAPDCPRCGRPMLKRTARRGASAGGAFWGCGGYPACKGTRPIG